MQPGQLATFDLTTTNNGTANLPDLTVSDPLPDRHPVRRHVRRRRRPAVHGDVVEPARRLPGAARPPVRADAGSRRARPRRASSAGRSRVGTCRRTPTVTIFYRYTLEPGVTAGDIDHQHDGRVVPGRRPASAPPPDVVGDRRRRSATGTYCTDPAKSPSPPAPTSCRASGWPATPRSAGTTSRTGQLVPGRRRRVPVAGRPTAARTRPTRASPSSTRASRSTTCCGCRTPAPRAPCRWRSSTRSPRPATPACSAPTAAPQWATAPTLAGPATYSGPSTGDDRLHVRARRAPPTCSSTCRRATPALGPTRPGRRRPALRLVGRPSTPTRCRPAATVDVSFTMNAPADVPRVSPTRRSPGTRSPTPRSPSRPRATRGSCAPLEPLKVGRRHDVRQPPGRQADRRQPGQPAARRRRVHVRLRLHARPTAHRASSGDGHGDPDHAGRRDRHPRRLDVRGLGDRHQRRHPRRHRRRPRRAGHRAEPRPGRPGRQLGHRDQRLPARARRGAQGRRPAAPSRTSPPARTRPPSTARSAAAAARVPRRRRAHPRRSPWATDAPGRQRVHGHRARRPGGGDGDLRPGRTPTGHRRRGRRPTRRGRNGDRRDHQHLRRGLARRPQGGQRPGCPGLLAPARSPSTSAAATSAPTCSPRP